MRRCPQIGDRVRYPGGISVGPCIGTVVAIYPTFSDEFDRGRGDKLLPEPEWHVGVRVDHVPVPWCYEDTDRFAPPVSSLRAAAGVER